MRKSFYEETFYYLWISVRFHHHFHKSIFIAFSVDETSVLQFKIFLACRLPLSIRRSVLRRDLFPSWAAVWRAAGLPGRDGRTGLSRLWVPLRGRDLFPSWEAVWRAAGLPGRYGRTGLSRLWVPLRGRDLFPGWEAVWRTVGLPGRYGRAGLSRLWVPLRGRDLHTITEQMRRHPSLQVSLFWSTQHMLVYIIE